MALLQPFAQQLAGLSRGGYDLGLFSHIGDHIRSKLDALPMDHAGDAHLAGFPEPATVAGSRPLPRDLGHGFDEVVQQKFLLFIGREPAAGAPYPHGHGQLAPKGVAGLVTELEPALQQRMGGGIEGRIVIGWPNAVTAF